jgi:hypothetical protein
MQLGGSEKNIRFNGKPFIYLFFSRPRGGDVRGRRGIASLCITVLP